MAPRISRTAVLVFRFSELRLWAMVLTPVGWASMWARPVCNTKTIIKNKSKYVVNKFVIFMFMHM
jgi:hypothetical protein